MKLENRPARSRALVSERRRRSGKIYRHDATFRAAATCRWRFISDSVFCFDEPKPVNRRDRQTMPTETTKPCDAGAPQGNDTIPRKDLHPVYVIGGSKREMAGQQAQRRTVDVVERLTERDVARRSRSEAGSVRLTQHIDRRLAESPANLIAFLMAYGVEGAEIRRSRNHVMNGLHLISSRKLSRQTPRFPRRAFEAFVST